MTFCKGYNSKSIHHIDFSFGILLERIYKMCNVVVWLDLRTTCQNDRILKIVITHKCVYINAGIVFFPLWSSKSTEFCNNIFRPFLESRKRCP